MPAPILSTTLGISLLRYEFHQIAIFTRKPDQAIDAMNALGYFNWIEDNADLVGVLEGKRVVTKATMHFNYDFLGREFEFLTYHGPNRHSDRDQGEPFISHMSTYVDDIFQAVEEIFAELDILPYHRFITTNHTSPGVAGKKRFIEAIYDFQDVFGFDLKLIQKVPHDFDDESWLGWKTYGA